MDGRRQQLKQTGFVFDELSVYLHESHFACVRLPSMSFPTTFPLIPLLSLVQHKSVCHYPTRVLLSLTTPSPLSF